MASKQTKIPKQPEPPKVTVRKTGKGIGVVEIPIHISSGPVRLPDNEADYLASARPKGRPDSPQETKLKDMAARGFSLEKICVATGCNIFGVARLLGLPTSGEDFDKTIKSLENRKRV